MLKAFEYIESIGGYKKMEEIERDLVKYSLEKFEALNSSLQAPSSQPSPLEEKEQATNRQKNAALLSSKGEEIQR